jgi:hypothetical protein
MNLFINSLILVGIFVEILEIISVIKIYFF